MIISTFEQINCVAVGEKCIDLPIAKVYNEEFNTDECVSCFEFEDDELVSILKSIKDGKRPRIYLSIIGGQPPISIGLENPLEK